jgi:hypothetical protein
MADVEDRDLGWANIRAAMLGLDGAHTRVGVQEGEIREDGKDLVIVAAVNEFGAPKANIPERSFIRSTVDEERPAVNRIKEGIVRKATTGHVSIRQELALLGEFAQSKIQRKIIDLKIPGNADSTKKKKGSDNPLVDQGQLHQSIRHVEVIP